MTAQRAIDYRLWCPTCQKVVLPAADVNVCSGCGTTCETVKALHTRQSMWAQRQEKERLLRKAWDNLSENDRLCTVSDSLYLPVIARLLADELASSEDHTFRLAELLRAGFKDFLQMEIDNAPEKYGVDQ